MNRIQSEEKSTKFQQQIYICHNPTKILVKERYMISKKHIIR